jgi:hypothetical protein
MSFVSCGVVAGHVALCQLGCCCIYRQSPVLALQQDDAVFRTPPVVQHVFDAAAVLTQTPLYSISLGLLYCAPATLYLPRHQCVRVVSLCVCAPALLMCR